MQWRHCLLLLTACVSGWALNWDPNNGRCRPYGSRTITRWSWTVRRPMPRSSLVEWRLDCSSMLFWGNVCYNKPKAREDMLSTLTTSTSGICTGMLKHTLHGSFRQPADPSSRLVNSLCFGGVDSTSLAGLGTSGLVPRANEYKWICIAWIRRAMARVGSPGCIGRRGRRWRLRRTSQRLRRRRLSRRRQSQARLVCVCVGSGATHCNNAS